MQVQPRVEKVRLERAIEASQGHLLARQSAAGYWWAELESNVTMTAEVVLLHKIWGTDGERALTKAAAYLLGEQRAHGGWELFYGDGGDLSTSIEAYMGLKLLGLSAAHPALVRAREFIVSRGGISRSRIFTKIHLALIGCYDWRGIPSLPPWAMLLPAGLPVSIYELSSWARGSTVPLLVVFDRKPVFATDPAITLDELYAEGRAEARFELPRHPDDWFANLFVDLDRVFKLSESLGAVPWREEGVRAAERWVIERQEASGDWGGIIPAMLNSLLALRCLGYDACDPVVRRGMVAVDRFVIETESTYRVQPCVSPVWDTALTMRALVDAGCAPDHPALVRAGEWILTQQILDYGDWSIKNTAGPPGGWAFEFVNRYYPDVDDTAVVVMALEAVRLPDEVAKRQAMVRAERWVASMQCREGGWAAFDIDNDAHWLNSLPYADLKAMIDPNTADVTARVLEMYGRTALTIDPQSRRRALDYLRRVQEPEGCWFGRWGVNYIYGTSGVIAALVPFAPEERAAIERAAAWLVQCQNPDGGWGETCRSYDDRSLMGQGPSTASQTAWALIGLIEAAHVTRMPARSAIDRGIAYLLSTQKSDGSWDEAHFTGTGFPGHFYLKYHLYQQHFPLTALGRYRRSFG
ncbi:squalene--hopene cyclase [Gloeobacter kilaueensis]|uniref:Squalene-hopene cyclase n=1 Tax=Gloeobacter kilaueensis (strain ATCC BAA-2537 / CCAP 1431/1 / ULC 316 / JS1) TaxID=1183438 RepID=U5QM17_GLOK1|nr:squalene--hopene cyclase [Gloeobacter kilaueensis]AGY58659.1 squalene-hopene cyclase [Gloeobacter kilaueensis JS1]